MASASQKYYWKNTDMALVVNSSNALTVTNKGNDIYTNVPGEAYDSTLNEYQTYSSNETNPPFYDNNGVSIFRNIKVKSDTINTTSTTSIPNWCNAIKIYVQLKNGNDGTDSTLNTVNNSTTVATNATNENTNDNWNNNNRRTITGNVHNYSHHRHNRNQNEYTDTNINYNSHTNFGGKGSTGRTIGINKAISVRSNQNIKTFISETSGISRCEVYISPVSDSSNQPVNWNSRIMLQSANGNDATMPQTQNSVTTTKSTPWADHNKNTNTEDNPRDYNVVGYDEARETIAAFHNAITMEEGTVHGGNFLSGGYNDSTFLGLANINATHNNVTINPSTIGLSASDGTVTETLTNVGVGSEITTTDSTITSNQVQIFYFLI